MTATNEPNHMSDLKSKTDEELNRMLATCLGWQPLTEAEGWAPSTCKTHMAKPDEDLIASPPKFCASLDEVAKVEAGLDSYQHQTFRDHLHDLCKPTEAFRMFEKAFQHERNYVSATARQRTIALIATLTKQPAEPSK